MIYYNNGSFIEGSEVVVVGKEEVDNTIITFLLEKVSLEIKNEESEQFTDFFCHFW